MHIYLDDNLKKNTCDIQILLQNHEFMLTPVCFFLNSPSYTLAKGHGGFTILSLYDAFIFINKV